METFGNIVVDDEVYWPEKDLKYLVRNYKPKDREIPYVAVVLRG